MNGGWKRYLRQAVACLAGFALAGALTAQQDQGPQRRAVRISSVDGQVELSQGGTVITDHALVNLPIFEGTQVVTGDDGRVELEFDDGSVARVPPDSSLTLAKLDPDGETTVVLDSGMGYFEVQGTSGQPQMKVRFGDAVATANGFSILRIKMDQPPGQLAVLSGDATLNEGDGAVQVDVQGGESIFLSANDPSQYTISENIEPDSWDQWNSDRDEALAAEAGDQNQNPAVANQPDSSNPAWGDLSQNGTWYDTPDQGYVWSPYEASDPGWDPYGMGNWVDQPGYGYMWVSGEPWGYLPYQCGAWNYFGGFGWGWSPGMCQPWWISGGGWGYNVGRAPMGYRRPVRPNPPRFHGGQNQKLIPANGVKGPIGIRPIIAVNRHMPPTNTVLPPRDKSTPVMLRGRLVAPVMPHAPGVRVNPPMIASHPEQPRAPIAPVNRRPTYTPPANGYRGGTQTWPTARRGYTPTAPAYPRPGEPRTMPAPIYRPPTNYGGARPAPAPRYSPPAPHYTPPPSRPAPAPHYSPPAPRAAPAPHAFWHPTSWFAPHSSQSAAFSHGRSSTGHAPGHGHSSGSRGGGHSSGGHGGGGSHGGGGHR